MFHDTFEKVINSLIFSNGRIGSNLSGGLDSSSVSRMISHIISKKKSGLELFCYSYHFSQLDPIDEEKTNELEYVKDVVSLGGFKSRIVEIKRGDYLSKLFNDQHMFPQPCVHGNRYQELALIKIAKKMELIQFLQVSMVIALLVTGSKKFKIILTKIIYLKL